MSKNIKVLLVEDDHKLRSTIEDYLQMNGFLVTACADGNAALSAFLSEDAFDIILLDGMLPNIDGFDVLK
ncbi:MAG: response regulator, partial [Ruminococcus sp.]|nr:response regulator [Ruminococcus sp.]